MPVLRQAQSPLIGIIGDPNSPLARAVDILFDASVTQEASANHPVPTASTAVAMAIGALVLVQQVASDE